MLRIHPASMTLSHSFRFSVLKKSYSYVTIFMEAGCVDSDGYGLWFIVSIFTELNNRLLGDIYNN